MNSPRRAIKGCDGCVEIDEANRSVVKTYLHPDHETAVRNAQREVAYALRLSEALAGCKGVACPTIVSLELSVPPRVVMEFCPGEELSMLLLRMGRRDARIAEISRRIHAGLDIYTCLFDEPYYDFCFNNMLFDDKRGTLTFLDFVIPYGLDVDGLDTPLEASLGRLVGCARYTLARPAFLFSPRGAYVRLIESVLAEFDGRISSDRVYASAHRVYSRMWSEAGRLRKGYYQTIGSLATLRCIERLRQGRVLAGSINASGARNAALRGR